MRIGAGKLGVVSLALAASGCGDATAPEEARFPIVEGLYGVETLVVSNSCRGFTVVDGGRLYVFFQHRGGRLEFRPPSFTGTGEVDLLDIGIEGSLEPDGDFEMSGAYTIPGAGSGSGDDVVVGFSMQGRFEGSHVEGEEHHLASFPGGSCEVVFRFSGEEI